MNEELVERVARAMAENAGFCWDNCTQFQWESDARAGLKAIEDAGYRIFSPADWEDMRIEGMGEDR